MIKIPSLIWWMAITTGMLILFFFAFDFIPPSKDGLLPMVHYYSLIVFRNQFVLQLIFYAAVIAHAIEAGIAFVVSRQLDHPLAERVLWTLQTFYLGFPSLRLLLAQREGKKFKKMY